MSLFYFMNEAEDTPISAETLLQATAAPCETAHPLSAETSPRAATVNLGEKFRSMADGLQKDIDAKYSDRRENTPKQMRQAATARIDGDNLQRAQRMMRALADHHDAGTVPATLARITTKAAIVELAQEFIDRSNAGYYDAGIAIGKPYSWRETAKQDQAAALWALLDTRGDSAARDAAQLQSDIAGLKFAGIDGYFSTPAPIVAMMIDQARMSDGLSLLEPSAGSGAILDAVKAEYPETRLTVFEKSHRLADILKRKGYELAGDDITDAPTLPPIDRVLMNPPFERGQDIEHVRIAFDLLKEGGRLVSIMSPAPFFHQSAKASAFRAWFDAMGGEKIDLPDGSFKSSGTGVSTVMVIIDKD